MRGKSRVIGFFTLLVIMGTGLVLSAIRLHEIRNAHYESATVVSIQRLDTQIVRFETKDGNLWDTEFGLEDAIDIGDRAVLTFKENDTETREDDIIIDVQFEKE